ncbi:hypothetical protein KGM_210999 [Danaus plexippus plexippus]|uniref:Homeobox domain-containing protein n=1 Tax=Danaus plexippus plexippus TaxID=278856 RepID=A0A212F1M4_DANPL|nr:hypothetical protein KGM_210999 [Danaus plexippus plexippus]
MAVFNSFTDSCENIATSSILEYYNTVGEYVKSTIPQFGSNNHTSQKPLVVIKDNNVNLWPKQMIANSSTSQYACTFKDKKMKYVHNHIPNKNFQNTNNMLLNISYVQPTICKVETRKQLYYNSNKHNSLKVNMKKKRKRTIFTTEQIIALEAIFQKKPYINRDERLMLMKKLQVSEKSIKVWFQNRRRLTDKKDKDYESDSPSSEDSSEMTGDRLTYIESQINKNTDEHGYVTLNDRVMSDLVHVINDYLSKDVSWSQPLCDDNKTTVLNDGVHGDIVMYEPISPVSLTDILDDFI